MTEFRVGLGDDRIGNRTAYLAFRGAYQVVTDLRHLARQFVAEPDVVLVADGDEVAGCLGAGGLKVQVVAEIP